MIYSYVLKIKQIVLAVFGDHLETTLNHSGVKLILSVLLVFILSMVTDFCLRNSFLGTRYRLFVVPGVIVHELSHALFCVLTGAKITKISLFDKEGGSVEHEKAKVPVVGQILISLAPILVGLAVLAYISKKIGLEPSIIDLDKVSMAQIFGQLKALVGHLNPPNYQRIVLVYFLLSVIVTMSPSIQDLRNIAITVLMAVCITISLKLLIFKNFAINYSFFDKTNQIIYPIIILLILLSVLSMILFVFTKLFKRE